MAGEAAAAGKKSPVCGVVLTVARALGASWKIIASSEERAAHSAGTFPLVKIGSFWLFASRKKVGSKKVGHFLGTSPGTFFGHEGVPLQELNKTATGRS